MKHLRTLLILCFFGIPNIVLAFELRINAGGAKFTDSSGKIWSADYGFNTGLKSNLAGVEILNTFDDALYRARRFDVDTQPELEYTFSVPNGRYQVNLHFVETYSGAFGPGLRTFDVFIEDQRLLSDFDIYNTAGGENRALINSFPNVFVSDGKLQIRFGHQVENPMIAAIEIIGNSAEPDQIPDPPVSNSPNLSFNFNSNDLSAWEITNESGINSQWSVTNGQLLQSIDTGDKKLGEPYLESFKLGTYISLKGNRTLNNYQFDADIFPLRDPVERDVYDGQDVGIMFRYQDINNYYRLSMNSRESYMRLEKRVAGAFSTLAVTGRGYLEDQSYHLQITVVGPLLVINLNGENLFSVFDGSLPSGSIALYTQDKAAFDNVSLSPAPSTPILALEKPLSYSVQTGHQVRASAIVVNRPTDSYVEFDFGGHACANAVETPVGSGRYSSDCGNFAQGSYDQDGLGLTASLYSKNDTLLASDQHRYIGIEGNQYLAVGDSITLGSYDLYSGDNQSKDGRSIGQQGFHAQLNDLLTASEQQPNMVFNAGVGGDRTYNTLKRIDSILERHPEANRMLLALGTNDAAGSTPLPTATYQSNMQKLVNKANAKGMSVWVPQMPPTLPATQHELENALKQDYNEALSSLNNVQQGPDFYRFFFPGEYDRWSLFYDSLHPNALGQHIMAQLWHNAITGDDTEPFYLDRLCNRLESSDCKAISPTSHKQTFLATGYAYYYVDATYTVTQVPSRLEGGIWIQTANSETNNSSNQYLTFQVDRTVIVNVAYDAGATSLPAWLTRFNDTGKTIKTTDPKSPTLKVYARRYRPGTINLGGNQAAGASGANSNYVVIVKQR